MTTIKNVENYALKELHNSLTEEGKFTDYLFCVSIIMVALT
jgi:hypothetical protein